ncbi:lactoylglutathione lyase [Acidithiobacillus ferrivorans SS3]|uniref:Lactoylglutathione lyase n=2 Tax=Acidithiobacillus ferrivorans TaxID=160808 RepID=G0JP31_9PROT|nr:lactoylglutathione lyase [Acidithiobacillus ferrivorans SS3]
MRLLHTMIRVSDLEKSIRFYVDFLGMRILRRNEYPEGRFTLVFLGYNDEAAGCVIELTFNWDISAYDLGTAYGHIAIEVNDAKQECLRIKTLGGRVVRDAGPMKHGTKVIAFVEDPDGYQIELVESK